MLKNKQPTPWPAGLTPCRFFALAFLVLPLLIGAVRAQSGSTLRVPAEYGTIQEAIATAGDQDTVLVAPGEYEELIDFLGKAITVKSERGPQHTVIKAPPPSGSVVTFRSGESLDSVLEGFTLHGDDGTTISGYKYGGGILCLRSSPTIRGNIIEGATRINAGGGIACLDRSSPLIEGNLIQNNKVFWSFQNVPYGGGIYLEVSEAVVVGNVIVENQAYAGAGIHCWSGFPLIIGNRIARNVALASTRSAFNDTAIGAGVGASGDALVEIFDNEIVDNVAGQARTQPPGTGGAIGAFERSWVAVERNLLVDNRSTGLGGAIWCRDSVLRVRHNVIDDNYAESRGGGAVIFRSEAEISSNHIGGNHAETGGGALALEASEVEVANCTIVDNTSEGRFGGAFYITAGSSRIVHSTIVGNRTTHTSGRGGAVFRINQTIEPFLVNSILWQNDAAEDFEISGPAYVVNSVVTGGWSNGEGVLDLDPGFVNREAGDFHLRFDSPLIDRGSSGEVLPFRDEEGDPRVVDGDFDDDALPDVGADEVLPETTALFGGVGLGAGVIEDVLFVNGQRGDRGRRLVVETREPIVIEMRAPSAGPDPAPFVLYAWSGAPDSGTVAPQPFGMGWAAFATPLNRGTGNTPLEVWNNLGAEHRLGDATRPSEPAPTTLIELPRGIPRPFAVTLQGFIRDEASTGEMPLSITNGIVIDVR